MTRTATTTRRETKLNGVEVVRTRKGEKTQKNIVPVKEKAKRKRNSSSAKVKVQLRSLFSLSGNK